MPDRLPPLSALRPFEAAARLESFSQAAEEIHLTHGAVSHQVRALEAFLGTALFRRAGRRVALTDEGRRFAESVRAALTQIADAAQAIRRGGRASRLTVTLLPSFASRWLLPRLGRFLERYPELQVNIDASVGLRDFKRDEVDIGIRFGRGSWPDVQAEKFMEDEYFPVASPRFNGGRLPREPRDLAGLPLLRSDREPWTPWFKAVGLTLGEPSGPEFNDASMMLQAAALGQGIALSRASIARGDLETGALVRLFDLAVPAREAYWLVCAPDRPPPPKVRAFRDWLMAERDAEARVLPPAPEFAAAVRRNEAARGPAPRRSRP